MGEHERRFGNEKGRTVTPNEVTSADGGLRVLFAFLAQWPAAAEFCRWADNLVSMSMRLNP